MNKRITLPSIIAVLFALLLTGCGTFSSDDYQSYNFPEGQEAKNVVRVNNRNNPEEVIAFARSLSKRGRYAEAADIYLDAAKRFKSKNGNFKIDCRMAAVRELWLAGKLDRAKTELSALENDQDIYSYSSEVMAIRKLRKLLNSSVEMNVKTEKAKG